MRWGNERTRGDARRRSDAIHEQIDERSIRSGNHRQEDYHLQQKADPRSQDLGARNRRRLFGPVEAAFEGDDSE